MFFFILYLHSRQHQHKNMMQLPLFHSEGSLLGVLLNHCIVDLSVKIEMTQQNLYVHVNPLHLYNALVITNIIVMKHYYSTVRKESKFSAYHTCIFISPTNSATQISPFLIVTDLNSVIQ